MINLSSTQTGAIWTGESRAHPKSGTNIGLMKFELYHEGRASERADYHHLRAIAYNFRSIWMRPSDLCRCSTTQHARRLLVDRGQVLTADQPAAILSILARRVLRLSASQQ
jgi:hypothetical protein